MWTKWWPPFYYNIHVKSNDIHVCFWFLQRSILILNISLQEKKVTNKMSCNMTKPTKWYVHPPSLIRVFAVRMKKAWGLSYQLSAQQRLIRLSGCPCWFVSSLGAQSFCWFCCDGLIFLQFFFLHLPFSLKEPLCTAVFQQRLNYYIVILSKMSWIEILYFWQQYILHIIFVIFVQINKMILTIHV